MMVAYDHRRDWYVPDALSFLDDLVLFRMPLFRLLLSFLF